MLAAQNITTDLAHPALLKDQDTGHVYFVDALMRKRRVLYPEVVQRIKSSYSGMQVQEIDAAQLNEIEPGAVVPREWDREHWIEPPQNKQKMREIITSQLVGKGVEFGAGSRPMPLPLNAEVQYAEPFQSEEQYSRMQYTDNTVVAKLSNPIEKMNEIESDSLDFIVAAHVIEHTPNPVGAIVESFRCLKKGGKLVLVIPDKRRTFDKNRKDTEVSHLIEDFQQPKRERDLENYLDFFEFARRSKNFRAEAIEAHREGIDIHYHVWTPSSFFEMFSVIVDRFAEYSSFEVKPPVEDEHCLEFYLVATK